jgi:hypothetical protein
VGVRNFFIQGIIMKKLFCAAALCSALFGVNAANAALIDASTPIPDENILLNFNGLDWVYAGPIATNEWGAGNIAAPEFRASEGWRYATVNEWAARPDWTDFIIGGASVSPNSGFSDHSSYRFASEYWGNFSHVDLNDAAKGFITNGLDIGKLHSVWETWYVRDSNVSAVPVPAAVWLFGSGLAGLLGFNRKRAQAAA